MKTLFAVGFASLYGLLIRVLFGFFSDLMSIMSVTFLILIPVIIGFLTVLLMSKKSITTGAGAFFIPWVTSLVILMITVALNIEGSICWVMIYPLFAILAGIGGIIAFYIKKKRSGDAKNPDKSEWGKPNTLNMSLIVFLPALTGMIEGERTLIPQYLNITREVIIPATPKQIWKEVTHINELKSQERQHSFSTTLGFPHHLRTLSDTMAVGGKRVAIYEKGLYFKETITKYVPEKSMVLSIKTDPYNIPPTVMDEHILIGGKHIDILEDDYELEQLQDGSSRLQLSSHFYINTPFNWYAGIWANYLMSDILDKELNLIKQRVITKK